MSWITQLVEESGLVQFLGQEAKDEDIKSFFIESVGNAIDGSTSSNAKEVTLVANSVKEFLSDYDIELKDTKKLETACKSLLEKYLEKKEQTKKQPQKVKETKKPAGKKKGGKKSKNDDDDDDDFSSSKSKTNEQNEKTASQQNNTKNSKQKQAKASLLLLAEEENEDEQDDEEQDQVLSPKGKGKGISEQKNKNKQTASKSVQDTEEEEEEQSNVKQTKTKQKGKKVENEEDTSKKIKQSGKGKQKQEEDEADETIEIPKQQSKQAKKKKDRKRGKDAEGIEEQVEEQDTEENEKDNNDQTEQLEEEPTPVPLPTSQEKETKTPTQDDSKKTETPKISETKAVVEAPPVAEAPQQPEEITPESQTAESPAVTDPQAVAEKQPEKISKKEKKKLAKQQAANNNNPGAEGNLGLETNEGSDSTSKDIKIEKFDISVPGKVLFQNATLALSHGRKYGLVGPNGQGKSTLLKYISVRANEFRDIPKHFDIHYVEQEVVGDDTSAIDCVIAADVERLNLIAEEKKLMDSDDDESGERLSQIHARLDEIEAHSAEARASAILSGLQFTEEMKRKATKDFSGGWRMRISLARALFKRPTLLLLDEPTNHLDLLAVIWLETYLLKWKNTLLIVSHDQDFLNSICTDIIHVYQQKLNYYKGNYDKFKYQFNEYVTQMKKAHEKQKKLIEEERRRQQNKNEKTKSNDKVKDSTRVLRNKDLKKQADHKKHQKDDDDSKRELAPLPKDYNVIFEFPDPDSLSIPIIQVDDASFEYSPGNLIFKDLNFGIDMDSRIALVGPNGAGKSTLLKLLTGELSPTSGSIQRNRKLIIGRFTQHFVDTLNMDQHPIEYLNSKFPEYQPQELRGMLGRFGLTGQTHLQKISSLSGGQKSRVVFTEICMRHPHLLFLDEPTNHLDIESVDALAEALNEFKGGIILVSHDARLISEVCGNIWVVGDNTVTIFDGTFDDYRAELVEEFEEQEREEEERKKLRDEEKRKQREEQLKIRQEQLQRRHKQSS